MESASPTRPKTWNKSRRGNIPAYQYKCIEDIQKLNSSSKEILNIYGVVIDSRPVERSKGSDYFCILRIVDSSYCQGEGIKVTLFHHDDKMLPAQVNQWDIIRLHRVRSSVFNQDLSLISSRGWSWVAWPGKPSDDAHDDEFMSNSKSCTILDDDKEKVKSLRTWLDNRCYLNLDQARNASEEGKDTNLSNVISGSFFNLVCQVAGITKVNENCLIFKVWDSTTPSHKILPGAKTEDGNRRELSGLNGLDDFLVDVSVFDNHVLTAEEDPIELGSFVRFTNLHARRSNHNNNDAVGSNDCSELFLHGGIAFSRGVVTLDDESEEVVNLKTSMRDVLCSLKKFEQDEDQFSDGNRLPEKRKLSLDPEDSILEGVKKLKGPDGESTPKKNPPSPEPEFVTPPQHAVSHSLQDVFVQSQDTLAMLNGMDTPKKVNLASLLPKHDVAIQVDPEEIVSAPQATTNHSSEVVNRDILDNIEESQSDMRCHQKSATVVFGDDSPLQITPIREVLSAQVPLSKSKQFRIRARVCECSDLNNIVFHFCPASGLRIAAKNDGKNLELTDEAFEFIKRFRQHCGDKEDTNESVNGRDHLHEEASEAGGDDVAETQWFIVNKDEGQMAHVDSYENQSDKSKWETVTLDNNKNITRKRKANGKRFQILYREDRDCVGSLDDFSSRFNRVVRICRKEALIGRSLPPVARQQGIYYYCSPGCVGELSLPTLKEEAQSFDPVKPQTVLGCPVLRVIFYLQFVLEDDTDAMNATLKNDKAVSFFRGITPIEYLLNTDGCCESIADDMQSLISRSADENDGEVMWAEMIVEKKSRRPLPGNSKPVILYEIVKTRLAL